MSADKATAWELWQRSQALHCKPSDLIGFESDVRAFYFDRGIWLFARGLEAEMDAASNRSKTEKGKNGARKRILDFRLRSADPETPRKFKDPAAPVGVPKAPEDVDLGSDFFK